MLVRAYSTEQHVTGARMLTRIGTSAAIQAARCGGSSHCVRATSSLKTPDEAYSR